MVLEEGLSARLGVGDLVTVLVVDFEGTAMVAVDMVIEEVLDTDVAHMVTGRSDGITWVVKGIKDNS